MSKILTPLLVVPFFVLSSVSAVEDQNVLIVSGKGEVEIEPDMATITMGISTIDFSAQQAYLENNEKMSRVIGDLKELGVDKTDMKTTRFSIHPSYDHDRTTGEKRFRGYRVTHSIVVKVRNLESIGEVLDQIISAGVTDLSGISFGIQTAKEQESLARKRAVENAYTKAIELAQAAGVSLGRAIRIEEARYTPTSFGAGLRQDAAVPIEPGLHHMALTVTIHYLIK